MVPVASADETAAVGRTYACKSKEYQLNTLVHAELAYMLCAGCPHAALVEEYKIALVL